MSRTLSMNNGSVDSLNVSSTHGLSPNAFQIRLTVGCDIPGAFAIARVDQCVAPTGFWVRVFTTTASTWSSVTVRGTAERCSSANPTSRLATNRDRHGHPPVGRTPHIGGGHIQQEAVGGSTVDVPGGVPA